MNASRWAGWIATALAVSFLVFDGVIKLLAIGPVLDAFGRLGLPAELAVGIGVLELACLGIAVIPRTEVFGTVLMTGFLGGATVMHVRIGDPLFSHVLFPGYVGILLWGGLWSREPRLRALVPIRR